MTRVLDVYLKDRKAGELKRNEDAALTFTYDSGYLATDPVALSVSLPLRDEPFTDRAARGSRSQLLRSSGNRAHGRVTNENQHPANPARFTASPYDYS